MKQRILSTCFLWGFIGIVLAKFGFVGGIFLLISLATLTIWEMYELMERIHLLPYKRIATFITAIALAKYYLQNESICNIDYILSTIAISTILFALITVLQKNPKALLISFLPTIFGITYILIAFALPIALTKILTLYYGSPNIAIALILWIIVVAKFSDVGGLVIGCKWGKHKLIPELSPKKSFEGLLGSFIFSAISGIIFAKVCDQVFLCWPDNFTFWKMIIISCILSFFALVSDLIESGFKRLANVKDSGKIIPGIGGIFDLSDSLILTLPLGVILIKNFIL